MEETIILKKSHCLSDAKTIAALAEHIWMEHYTPIIGSEQADYMVKKFQNADQIYLDSTTGGYHYLIAYLDEKAVGYSAAKADAASKGIFLSKLYLEKEARGKGIAKKIIGEFRETFQPMGYHFIWLVVNKNNHHSIAAYQKIGFQIIEDIITEIGDGYVMDDYKMRLELD